MNAKGAMMIIVLLAAASARAQSPAPAPSPAAPSPVFTPDSTTTAKVIGRLGRNRTVGASGAAPAQLAPREGLQEMESTLSSMHALLKQMQDKNASSRLKDPIAKANLEMWELLLSHLDKELHQLQVATAARESVEARRAALYNQAFSKAAAEAAAAGQTPPAAGQTPPAPSTPVAPRPNQPKE